MKTLILLVVAVALSGCAPMYSDSQYVKEIKNYKFGEGFVRKLPSMQFCFNKDYYSTVKSLDDRYIEVIDKYHVKSPSWSEYLSNSYKDMDEMAKYVVSSYVSENKNNFMKGTLSERQKAECLKLAGDTVVKNSLGI